LAQSRLDYPSHYTAQPVGSDRGAFLIPSMRGRMTDYPEPSQPGPSLQMFAPPTSRTPTAMPPTSSDRYSNRHSPSYSSPSLPEHMRQKSSTAGPGSISRPGSTSQVGYMPYDPRRNQQYYYQQMRALSPSPQNNNPINRETHWPRAPSGLNIGDTTGRFQDGDDSATPIAISSSNQPVENYVKDRASSNKYECEYCGKGFTRPSSLKVHTKLTTSAHRYGH
jgi:hypothetical protein